MRRHYAGRAARAAHARVERHYRSGAPLGRPDRAGHGNGKPAARAGSWDRFIIALPFSRGVVRWGEAILVARDEDGFALESARRELEERLNTLGADADGACGHAPLLPAPPAAEAVGPLPAPPSRPRRAPRTSPRRSSSTGGTTRVLAPLIGLYLRHRRSRGKEEPGRLGERLGRASLTRPDGELVWLHAASVGETVSVLTVIERVLAAHDRCHVLLTTGTRTSAALAAERLPARACHQFVPADRPDAVRRFLKHWRPDLALWVESELWPNLITAARARGIPMVLLNARMSARSFARWRRGAQAGGGGDRLFRSVSRAEPGRGRALPYPRRARGAARRQPQARRGGAAGR